MMEEESSRGDLHGNVVRQSSLRPSGSLKSTLSGRSTPRNSPSFRRLHSSRTPRREAKSSGVRAQWFRSNRLVFWLTLITLWAYLGFYVQSKWAHGDNKDDFWGFGSKTRNKISKSDQNQQRDLMASENSLEFKNETSKNQLEDVEKKSNLKSLDVVLAKKENSFSSRKSASSKRRSKRSGRRVRGKMHNIQKANVDAEERNMEVQEEEIPKKNTSYGLLVGPFGSTEDRILEWSPEKRSGTCERKGEFARLVWSRKFVLIFHELSMTGAPLSMMELATELLSCGATVSAVVLSKKGGLMPELARRRIKVLDDRADHSFKVSMKADLVIAGSAVCASWIGIACSLNTQLFSTEKMLQKRQLLRNAVRKDMGLTDNDMLVISLSSINPGKGQLLLLESVRLIMEEGTPQINSGIKDSVEIGQTKSSLVEEHHLRALLQNENHVDKTSTELHFSNESFISLSVPKSNGLRLLDLKAFFDDKNVMPLEWNHNERKLLSENVGMQEQALKVLIGSVGSKSNKVPYVKRILRFLSQHSNLSKSVLWTPATTRVASLYSAADVYVINAQGLGETFGRVTIEAMAFGLPLLGTESGGTKEIVEHNVTGLLHPIGRAGSQVLSENIQFLLRNPSVRRQMGMRGRRKVEKMYLKRHMYKRFSEVLYKCMRIK
ncbi:uncharacterized protein LOC131157766 isoform X3 [Malania oleifera]|uniref:uncharacterized protein LOC131157766 isoform X3 n=1 Tax=Malania oleifera TaxID=397392 RepID=UPI0025ADC85C|nr:uncharacterized protein LOC131157766 isoform X3 [Malania oleifera]XP_057968127.1 uncharacterized protein LOC131157766 isoform X3 [Malania oleifera]XP_057968128.1 uncharacterized protein LOC131157766 isoform X3 [Malania oleifera]XP_057968129.1 uncharacterized protein LOC131157766 isoform X3 [Malania oleifera]